MKKVRPPFVHSDELRKTETASPRPPAWPREQLQAFDWKSAASLRAPAKVEPRSERDWDSTEWGELPGAVPDEAKRIAEQLNEVATKIRNGEIAVDGKAPTPETAMAAALEALIKSR